MTKSLLSVVVLAGASFALAAPAVATSVSLTPTLSASLDGPSVPLGGDPNGSGTFAAMIDTDNSRLCYQLQIQGVSNPTMGHIHEGAQGEPGRPVVNLNFTQSAGDGEGGNQACASVNSATLQAILDDPADYYVDVISSAYPKGAVRGQLAMGG